MTSYRLHTRFSDHSAVPWANGAGSTVELIGLSESAAWSPGGPRWRLSVASLERPAPFSTLPGLQRTFLPTAAVGLRIAGIDHELPPLTARRFSGDAPVELYRLPQPCHAVNLMEEGTATLEMDIDGGLLTVRDASGAVLAAVALTAGPGFDRFDLLFPAAPSEAARQESNEEGDQRS